MILQRFLPILFSIAVLSFLGCSSNEPGASSTDKSALIREVFSGWTPKNNEFPFSGFGLSVDPSLSYTTLVVSPELVVPLSESLVVLLTKAGPPSAGHSSPAMLGAYWFSLKDKRWILTKRQDEVAWLGSSGDFGTVHAKPFTNGVVGVFVEHGWAGMGTESMWLTPFKLNEQKISFLLPENDTLTLYEYDGSAQWYDCDAWLDQAIGYQKSMKVLDSQKGVSDRCSRLKVSWDVMPRGANKYPDIELSQIKRKVSVTLISSKEVNEGYDTENTYKLKLLGQEGKLVLRYNPKKEKFKVIKGVKLEDAP